MLCRYRKHPFDIYVTLLRDPVQQALSFYHYVNDRSSLPPWLHPPSHYPYQHIWRYTFRRGVREWAATEWVQRSLAQLQLRQFLPSIRNVTDNVAGSIDVRDSLPLCVCLSLCLSMYLSVCLSLAVCSCICLPLSVSVHVFVYLTD